MNFKKWFKPKPHWLKGGIITSGIGSVLVLFLITIGGPTSINAITVIFGPVFMIGAVIAGLGVSNVFASTSVLILGFLLNTAYFFVIGIGIGAIYGKFELFRKNIFLFIFVIFLSIILLPTILISAQRILENRYEKEDGGRPTYDGSECKGNNKDICYIMSAQLGDNDSVCEKIQDQQNKNECYETAALYLEDPLICRKIDNRFEMDGCLAGVSFNKRDPSVCEEIGGSDWKNLCYCRSRTERDQCDDISICNVIDNQELKDDCYDDVAHQQGNLSICDNIQEQRSKDYCYAYVSIQVQDPSVCEKIRDKIYKKICVKQRVPY